MAAENPNIFQHQPFDESLDVADSSDIESPTATPRAVVDNKANLSKIPEQQKMSSDGESEERPVLKIPKKIAEHKKKADRHIASLMGDPGPRPGRPVQQPTLGAGVAGVPGVGNYEDEEEDEEGESGESSDEDDDDDEDDEGNAAVEGAYNPADYESLNVSQDIKELFQYIQRYTPQTIDLENRLRPFIPDYIPAVGDIDAFLKVPRPDHKPDGLGLIVLDEPCANQSDPTVLDLQLRAVSKQTTSKQMTFRSLDDADKKPREIDKWIKSITELHRTKPPAAVHYNKNMPDIESLMQEWPAEFEDLLKEAQLPSADLECDLATYVDVICGLLDIPVYNNRIHSLHVLFTLFSEFRNSQHFQSMGQFDG